MNDLVNKNLLGQSLQESKMSEIRVSVIIPVRNEGKFIDKCIQSLLQQDYAKEKMEFIFVDGNSEDETIKCIEKYRTQYPLLFKLKENEKKTVPYAMNIGIQAAIGEYIVRLDAHSKYASDYITQCVTYLDKTNADNVGGPMIAKGEEPIQQVISASYYSVFAMGGGKFHDEYYEGYADTVYLGAYKKKVLLSLGGYDEAFTRNQDDELNFRLIKRGGKIFITPHIKSEYFPRNSYKKLFSQYYQYGWWKVAVMRKHGEVARITHLIPVSFVVCLLLGFLGSMTSDLVFLIYSSILGAYLLLNAYFSFSNSRVLGFANKLRLMGVHFILHISYGIGFLNGIFKVLKI